MPVEPARPEDRAAVLAAARSVGLFTPEEIDTVDELFAGYLRDPEASGYHYLVARPAGLAAEAVLGFACWGPTSLSKGAVDLYWICTAQAAQGRGVAAELFAAVVAAARGRGRWLLVIWTSSRPEYAAARRFYERMGCELSLRLADFYDHGDDLCVFTRRLDRDEP